VSESERNHAIRGAQGFDRDHFMQLKRRCQSDRGVRSNHLPAIDAFAGTGLAAGTLFHRAGMNLDGIRLGTESHKGQPADQGDCQPHIGNLIPTPLQSNDPPKALNLNFLGADPQKSELP